MTMMSELIDAYNASGGNDPAVTAALADALVATGPLRHGDRLFWAKLHVHSRYTDHDPPSWADEGEPTPARYAADTPIPR